MMGILFVARPGGTAPFSKSETALLQHLASYATLTLSHLAVQNELLEVALEAARQYEEMHEIFIGTIASLANAIDAKSSWTKGHSERVMTLTLRLAREMGLDQEETEQLRIAALLHDVGKIGIIEALLEKPARLSDEEFPPMRLHPAMGVAILAPIQRLRDILPGILHHHESFDGSGYPAGLKGEDIPLPARIIAVADAYDAMVSGRPYRKGRSLDNAVEELERCAGSQFDPSIVRHFITAMKRRSAPKARKQQ
jgi:HD-GYP domain-containing protein (c-di-GMP phosphodiesterase class II)